MNEKVLKCSSISVLRNVQYFLKGVGSKRDAAILQGCFSEAFLVRAQMRPSADGGQRARAIRAEDSSFRDDEDSRPSPDIPRDGNQRGVHDEQTEQQRLTIDWDAAAGSSSGEEIAYSAYLNPEGSSEQYLVQMQDIL